MPIGTKSSLDQQSAAAVVSASWETEPGNTEAQEVGTSLDNTGDPVLKKKKLLLQLPWSSSACTASENTDALAQVQNTQSGSQVHAQPGQLSKINTKGWGVT